MVVSREEKLVVDITREGSLGKKLRVAGVMPNKGDFIAPSWPLPASSWKGFIN